MSHLLQSITNNANTQLIAIVFITGVIVGLSIGYRRLVRYKRKVNTETCEALTLIQEKLSDYRAEVSEMITQHAAAGTSSNHDTPETHQEG